MIYKKNNQKGAAMIFMVLFFMIISTTLLISISLPISNQVRNVNDFLNSRGSFYITESQIENSLLRFNKGKIDAPSDINILGYNAIASLIESGDEKTIIVQGNKDSFYRYIKSVFKIDNGVSFNYGLQTGIGGLILQGSSYVDGNVYSNGNIIGNGSGTYITGSAISATISNPEISFSISSTTLPKIDFIFGTNNTNQDIAQSFISSTSTPINEIQLYIKKNGTPANLTIKIVTDNNGVPSANVLATGNLSSSIVTNSYSYVSIPMNNSINLIKDNTYWVVLDNQSNNNSNYYSLTSYVNSYPNVNTKQGRFGNSMNDIDINQQYDFDMKVYVGGDKGVISNINVGTSGSGNAWANTINNVNVLNNGNLFCQIGSNNNKDCDTSKSDPLMLPMPISDANIQDWKDIAQSGNATNTVIIGGNDVKTLGPIKINGDLKIQSNGKLYITGPIYVTGSVDIGGSGKIYIHESLGSLSSFIIADDFIKIEGSGGIYGSGLPGSYIILSSTKTCDSESMCLSNPSIDISGSAGSVILNAINGSVKISGSSDVKSIVAKTVIMSGSSHVKYESGVTNVNFTSGPSGSWVIKTWEEITGW